MKEIILAIILTSLLVVAVKIVGFAEHTQCGVSSTNGMMACLTVEDKPVYHSYDDEADEQPKPKRKRKPLTTKWLSLDQVDWHSCKDWKKEYGGECHPTYLLIEIGLRSDGQVVWRRGD